MSKLVSQNSKKAMQRLARLLENVLGEFQQCYLRKISATKQRLHLLDRSCCTKRFGLASWSLNLLQISNLKYLEHNVGGYRITVSVRDKYKYIYIYSQESARALSDGSGSAYQNYQWIKVWGSKIAIPDSFWLFTTIDTYWLLLLDLMIMITILYRSLRPFTTLDAHVVVRNCMQLYPSWKQQQSSCSTTILP